MATVTTRLVPSAYTVSNASYASVTDPDNMYTNTDSTSYARLNNTRSSTSNTYYIYIHSFNFNDIPLNAENISFSIKIKISETNLSTGSSYRLSLYNGSTAISNTTISTNLSTSIQTLTFPIPTTLTWSTLTGYGDNFRIRVPLRRASTNSNSYASVYGAEIAVTYTVPSTYNVTINGTQNTSPTGLVEVEEGDNLRIRMFESGKPTVTDNGTDVTSQVQQAQNVAAYTVNTVGSYGFTLTNGYYTSTNKGVDKSAAVCRVDFYVPVAATVTFSFINYAEQGYDFGVFGNIDTPLNTNYYVAGSGGATISDSNYRLACNTATYNVSSVQTLTYNMSAGDHFIYVKFSKDDGTASNNDTLQFQVSITLNSTPSFSTYWYYDLLNVLTSHTINVVAASQDKMYVRINGSWVQATKVYKKVNGSWVEQADLTTVFISGTNYLYGS